MSKHHANIITQTYNDKTDREKVYKIFGEGIRAGVPASVMEFLPLIKQRFGVVRTLAALLSLYITILFTFALYLQGSALRTATFAVFALLVFVILLFLKRVMAKLCDEYISRSLKDDLADIPRHYLSDPNKRHMWVAVDTNTNDVVGCVAVEETDRKGVAELRRMSARADYRGKGVAQLLLRTLEEFCRQNGYHTVFLTTITLNKAAMRFYIKSGFKQLPDTNRFAAQLPFFMPVSFPSYEKHL
jgi:GNAT superfamily N-acetyltransferase